MTYKVTEHFMTKKAAEHFARNYPGAVGHVIQKVNPRLVGARHFIWQADVTVDPDANAAAVIFGPGVFED